MMGGAWWTDFPGERVDYHLKTFGHLPEESCGDDVRLCSKGVTIIESEHGLVATNGKVRGWVSTRTGSLVSQEYAQSLNRRQRRAEGIRRK